jgi:hypothetical protein
MLWRCELEEMRLKYVLMGISRRNGLGEGVGVQWLPESGDDYAYQRHCVFSDNLASGSCVPVSSL